MNLAAYLEKRILLIFFLGISSGLPLALTGGTFSIWLKENGIPKEIIGVLGAMAIPYSLKFLWAPVIDKLSIPALSALLGRRRSWMLATQAALIVAIIALGFANPADNILLTAICAFLLAFCSASQDIVIDAYRVEILDKDQYGTGAAAINIGYRMGMLVSGAGALYLSDTGIGWRWVYAIMSSVVLVGIAATLLGHEPEAKASAPGARNFLREGVINPFLDYMSRPGWQVFLLFILFYKFGDAFAGAMASVFYKEIGFSNSEIASVTKVFGLIAALAGSFAGGVAVKELGLIKSLWICGILQAVSNLAFCYQANAGHNIWALTFTIAVENFSGGMGTVAFVTFLSGLCNISYTATQYALLSSIASVGRIGLSTPTGYVAKAVGWEWFFAISFLAALPGLLLIRVMKKYLFENPTCL